MEAQPPLRIFFFPFSAMGHIIPLINMAKLFSRHGAAATIITTSGNEPVVRPALTNSPVDLLLIPLPQLPPNSKENFSHIKNNQPENIALITALYNLKKPLEDLLRSHHPDCVVFDGVFPWSADIAVSLGIPRIIFYVFPIFSMSVIGNIMKLPNATDESREVLATEGLPNRIEIARSDLTTLLNSVSPKIFRDEDNTRFGTLFNTFYEFEHEYIDLHRKNHRAWCVGPVSLLNESVVVDSQKLDQHTGDCLKWLDTLSPERSVVYACFGSMNEFSTDQLRDIALGLEASGHPFVWVVSESFDTKLWLPEGFELRIKGKSFLLKGWVPQDTILNHPAIGGFVTHCGSNSVMEGVTAGLPMVTWPLMYDQFIIEKLITDVLKIGVSADRGRKLSEAVQVVMGSEGTEMSRRVREYKAKAKEAMEVGGSSYGDVTSLIGELRNFLAGRGEGAK